jgi:uncharacterized protein YjbI with pentapeptide repeats
MRTLFIALALLLVSAAGVAAVDVPPSLALNPSPGTTVETTVTLTAIAVDVLENAGMVSITLFQDGVLDETHNCLGATTCTFSKTYVSALAANHTYFATATDLGDNTVVSSNITITFLGANTPPKWVGLPTLFSVFEDSGFNVNLTNLTALAQDNQTPSANLTYSILNQTNAVLVLCSIGANFLNCNVTWANASGSSIINLSVSDGVLHDTKLVNVTVIPVNDVPFNNVTFPLIAFPEDTYNDSINLDAFFFDIDGPATLAYSFINTNPNLTITATRVNATLAWLNASSTNNYTGVFNFTILVSDGLNSSNITAVMSVTPVNDQPFFLPVLANQFAHTGMPFTYDLNATDIDTPTVFSFFTNSTLFAIAPGTGVINFTPLTFGNFSINATVCDDSGAVNNCTSGEFNLTITDITPPVIVALIEPVDPAVFNDSAVYGFGINLTDLSGIGSVSLTFNGVSFANATNISNTFFNITIGNRAAGNYTYTWAFADIFGNANTSLVQNFSVLRSNSSINLSLDGIEGNITVASGSGVSAFAFLSLPLGRLVSLLQNSILVASGFSPLNITLNYSISTVGLFNITAAFEGDENFTPSQITRFIQVIDLQPPFMLTQSTLPVSPAVYSATAIYQFLSSWTDNINMSAAVLEFNGTNITTINTSASSFAANITLLPVGNYTYVWIANDTSNNVNVSIIFNYSVSAATPTVAMDISPATTVVYGATITANCSASTPQVTPSQFRNGTPIANPDIATLAAGTYNYTCAAAASQNFTDAVPVNAAVTVLQATPVLTLSLLPSSSVTVGTSTTASCTASTAQVLPVLARNAVPVANPEIITLDVGVYNYSCTSIATENFTAAGPVSSLLSVSQIVSSVRLLLNNSDSDIVVPENSTVNITGELLTPAVGTISLIVNGTTINTGSSPLSNLTFFGNTGIFPVVVNFSGDANTTSSLATHFVIIGEGLAKFNFTPSNGAVLNTSFVTMAFNTNLNTTCRWSLTNLDHSAMTNDFAGALTTHNGFVFGLEPLGLHTVFVGCVNDTTATNAQLTYNVSNIIENSSIDAALIQESIVRFVNISPSTSIVNSILYFNSVLNSTLNNVTGNQSLINNSVLTNCLVINSTVKNIIASDCEFRNSFVDPSDLTGSNISGSVTLDSNVTFSNVTTSTIDLSTVDLSAITSCTVNQSQVRHSQLGQCTVKNNTILDNTAFSGSTLITSNFNNSNITGSTLTNVNGTGVNISNNILNSGNVTVVTGGVQFNVSAVANLSEFVEMLPTASFVLSPGSSISPGTTVTFTSTSSDPNIGTALNDSLALLWQFSDSTTDTASNVSKTFASVGSFPFNLTATDRFGQSSIASGTITVASFSASSGGGGGGGGGSGGGGGGGIGRTFFYNLTRGETQVMTLGRLDKLIIEYQGINYLVENVKIARDHGNFTLAGRPVRMIVGQLEKYNLNRDQFYDLVITFTRNYVSRIELRLSSTHDLAPGFNVFSLPSSLQERKEIIPPKPAPAAQPAPGQQKAEVTLTVTKPWLSRAWEALTGRINLGGFSTSGWMITLLIIVLGVLLYAVLVELFEW